MVQLYLVHTLFQLVSPREGGPSARDCLSQANLEAILDFSLQTMLSAGGVKRALLLYQEAERTVLAIAKHLVAVLQRDDKGDGAEQTLLRLLDYFVGTVRAMSSEPSLPLPRLSPPSTPPSAPSQPPNPSPRDLPSPDPLVLHLMFALRSLQSVFLGFGDLSAMRILLARSPSLQAVLDPLGLGLLGLLARRERPPQVLQAALGLFAALYASTAPTLRLLLECVLKQVYLRALQQALDLFLAQVTLT